MPEGSQRIALLGVLAALTVAVAGVIVRRRVAASPAGDLPADGEPQTFTCSCGREYRTSGAGRHRVYWPAEAPEGEPVLGDDCPGCGKPLPAQPERATA